MSIAENIARVRERMQIAAERAGRNAETITLMAVSKTFPASSIREAYAAGLRVFGENRVQEFAGKVEDLRDLEHARWHMIGHLQSNKAVKAAEMFHAVDSVDSVKLAEKLNEPRTAPARRSLYWWRSTLEAKRPRRAWRRIRQNSMVFSRQRRDSSILRFAVL